MDIIIPTIPAGIVILINFFAPYATSLVIASFWPAAAKKWVAVGVSLILSALVLVLAFFGFGEPIPPWPVLLLLGVVVSQFTYAAIVKESADKVTETTGVGASAHAILVALEEKKAA